MALVTVGFNQIGQHSTWYDPENNETDILYFDSVFPLKQYTLTKDITRLCTAGYYKYFDNFGQDWGIPVLFSDNNRPHEKLSVDESMMNLYCANSSQAGWVSGSFKVKRTITAGFFERLLYRKPLNRVELVLYSAVNTELVLRSKL